MTKNKDVISNNEQRYIINFENENLLHDESLSSKKA